MSLYALSGRTSLKFGFLATTVASAVLTNLSPGALFSLPTAQAESPATETSPPEAAALENLPQSWQLLTSTTGNFSVLMPSKPAAFNFLPATNLSIEGLPVTDTSIDSPLYLQMQLVEATRLEIYAVASTMATDFIEPGDSPNESLLRCVSSLNNQNVQAVISTVRLGEKIGIEAESFSLDEGLQVSRCYLTGDRAYIISVTSKPFQAGASLQPSEGDNSPLETRSPTMTAFLDSFEISD
ncbi:MAG: hypothetical protein AAF716_08745 [Cyanobacteria bacterium P01_D01_bin.1]